MGSPATYFIDDTAVTARALEVPNASFVNGANNAGSCAPCIGINMLEGAVIGTPAQYTLLDQFGNARAAQISQHIGGSGLDVGSSGTLPDAVSRYGDSPTQAAKDADPDLDGTITATANCTLNTLALGWVASA